MHIRPDLEEHKLSKIIFSLLSPKHLRMVSDGLVMAHAQYCAPVYLPEKIKLTNDAPQNQKLRQIQVKQNSLLRILLNSKRSDHVKIVDMLQKHNHSQITKWPATPH